MARLIGCAGRWFGRADPFRPLESPPRSCCLESQLVMNLAQLDFLALAGLAVSHADMAASWRSMSQAG